MGALWRSRRWRYLLNRIDHLPRNSAYVEAVSQDEQLARLAMEDPPPRGDVVRMRDWSPELEALATMVDRLGDVVQAIVSSQGGRPPQIAAYPRPSTAADRMRDPRTEHERVLSKVMIMQEDGSLLSVGAAPPVPLLSVATP